MVTADGTSSHDELDFDLEEEDGSFYGRSYDITPTRRLPLDDVGNVDSHHNTGLAPKNTGTTRLVALMQEQQAMLRSIMERQNQMEHQQKLILDKQKEFAEKFVAVEEKLTSSQSSASSSPDGRVKNKISRELTVSYICYIPCYDCNFIRF